MPKHIPNKKLDSEAGKVSTPVPKKLTKTGLTKFLQSAYLDNLPMLVEELMPAFRESIKKREPWAIKAGLEIAGFTKAENGISINFNQQINQTNTTEQGQQKSFSSLVRRLELRDELDRKGGATVDVTPEG